MGKDLTKTMAQALASIRAGGHIARPEGERSGRWKGRDRQRLHHRGGDVTTPMIFALEEKGLLVRVHRFGPRHRATFVTKEWTG